MNIIGDSLDKLFQAANEKMQPALLSFNNLLYGNEVNPFDTYAPLFILVGFMTAIGILVFGIHHIIDRLQDYNPRQTLKKSVLIIVFLMLTGFIMLYPPGKTQTIPLNMSLIYVKGSDANASELTIGNTETGYKPIANKTAFTSASSYIEGSTASSYLGINIASFFNNSSNLSDIYTASSDIENYKNFIIGLSPVFVKYKDISIKDGYLSNLDLYGILMANSTGSGITGTGSNGTGSTGTGGDVGILGNKFADNNTLNSFVNYLYTNDDTIERKRDFLTEKTDPDNNAGLYPIKWKGKFYTFLGEKDNTEKGRKDIVLKHTPKEGDDEYIILPYYDIVSVITKGLSKNEDLGSFLTKYETETKSLLTPAQKIEYETIYQNILGLGINVVSEVKNSSNSYIDETQYTSSFVLSDVDQRKIEYIIAYNLANKNSNKFETKPLYDNTVKKVEDIIETLDLVKSNYININNAIDIAASTTDPQRKALIENGISNTRTTTSKLEESINNDYNSLFSSVVSSNYTSELNVLKVLLTEGGMVDVKTTTEFKALGGSSLISGTEGKYNTSKPDVQKNSVETLLSLLKTIQTNYLTDKELKYINILSRIEKLDKETPDIALENKNNITLYTIFEVIKNYEQVGQQADAEKQLLSFICKQGDINKEFLSYMNTLQLSLDKSIVDCSMESGVGKVMNKDNFKNFLYKILDINHKQTLIDEVNVVNYFSTLKGNDSTQLFFNFNSVDNSNDFLKNKISIGKYEFISPLVYYHYLITGGESKIEQNFLNLLNIKGEVYTADTVYNLKIGDKASWYKEVDKTNGEKYSNPLLILGMPFAHVVALSFLLLVNQILGIAMFLVIINVFLILLRNE